MERGIFCAVTETLPQETLDAFVAWLEAEGMVIADADLVSRPMRCPTCGGRGFKVDTLTPRERQLLARGLLRDHDRTPCPLCRGARQIPVEQSLTPAPVLITRFLGLSS